MSFSPNEADFIRALRDGSLDQFIQHQNRFGPACRFYSFTTENIRGYCQHLPLQGAQVVSVCGSGDQALNAILYGATHVTCFDINHFALYWTELKLHMISRLSFIDFNRFFMKDIDGVRNPKVMHYTVYCQMRDSLTLKSRNFFNALYAAVNNCGETLRHSSVFAQRFDRSQLHRAHNAYLKSHGDYNLLQRQLVAASCSLYTVQLTDIPSLLSKGTVDIVLLSNLADYSRVFFPNTTEHLDRFVRELVGPIRPLLRENGVICAAYVYGHRAEWLKEDQLSIDSPRKRRGAFGSLGLRYDELTFDGVVPHWQDTVVTLTLDAKADAPP